MMRRVFAGVIIAGLFTGFFMGEAFSAEKAVRVNQPAYHSMNFYVYKPANLPKDFYVTFDGYLVYKGAKGVWYYGSAEKSGIKKTGYVVGSVLPQVVRLKPYNAKTSSVSPVLGSPGAEEYYPSSQYPSSRFESKSNRAVYMPPDMRAEIFNPIVLTPNNPDWTQNSNFMAIGKWHKSVNKMGVLYRPNIPVAWKGDFPEVIYAWTGHSWRQLTPKTPYLTARSILRREIYDLAVYTNKITRLNWTEDDSHVLAQYAAMWGYEWAGQIILGRDYY